jgi:hypothetical protein
VEKDRMKTHPVDKERIEKDRIDVSLQLNKLYYIIFSSHLLDQRHS